MNTNAPQIESNWRKDPRSNDGDDFEIRPKLSGFVKQGNSREKMSSCPDPEEPKNERTRYLSLSSNSPNWDPFVPRNRGIRSQLRPSINPDLCLTYSVALKGVRR